MKQQTLILEFMGLNYDERHYHRIYNQPSAVDKLNEQSYSRTLNLLNYLGLVYETVTVKQRTI